MARTVEEARKMASEMVEYSDYFPNLSPHFLVQIMFDLEPVSECDQDFVGSAHLELEARYGALPDTHIEAPHIYGNEEEKEAFLKLLVDRQESPEPFLVNEDEEIL